MLPSDDDGAMKDGTSNIRRQLEPRCDQDVIDGQAQESTLKKRTPAATRRKQAATPKNLGIEPLTPGLSEEQVHHAYALRNQRTHTATGRLHPWTPLEEVNSFIRAHEEEPPAPRIANPRVPLGRHEGDM